jgi:hypothetical protein
LRGRRLLFDTLHLSICVKLPRIDVKVEFIMETDGIGGQKTVLTMSMNIIGVHVLDIDVHELGRGLMKSFLVAVIHQTQ